MSELQRTRSTYDVIAADYARNSGSSWPELIAKVERFVAALPRDAIVADIGCGPGRDTALLRERGLRAVGFDLSNGMLRAAVESLPVGQADMRALPIRDASLDGLWTQAALLHVPRTEVPAVLAEFARVVRPAGRMFLNCAEGDGERWEPVAYRPDQQRWFVYHDRNEVVGWVEAAGFVVNDLTVESSKREWINVDAIRIGDANT